MEQSHPYFLLESGPFFKKYKLTVRFDYRGWKLHRLDDGSFECVRMNPTQFFRSTSFGSAIKSIDRREDKIT